MICPPFVLYTHVHDGLSLGGRYAWILSHTAPAMLSTLLSADAYSAYCNLDSQRIAGHVYFR